MPYYEKDIEKKWYEIGEIASIIGVEVSAVRFWETEFPDFIKPKRRKKNGHRRYSANQLRHVELVHYLIKVRGFSIEGARRELGLDHYQDDARMRILLLSLPNNQI